MHAIKIFLLKPLTGQIFKMRDFPIIQRAIEIVVQPQNIVRIKLDHFTFYGVND